MKSWIGIDPGANGALCHLFENKDIKFIDFKTDGLRGYIDYLSSIEDKKTIQMVSVEQVSSMPGQGVKSMFSFGQRLGELEGMLQALKIGYIQTRPHAWQKTCKVQAKSGKKGIFEAISKIYPEAELLGSKGGIKDGRCDSLGIAHNLRLTVEF